MFWYHYCIYTSHLPVYIIFCFRPSVKEYYLSKSEELALKKRFWLSEKYCDDVQASRLPGIYNEIKKVFSDLKCTIIIVLIGLTIVSYCTLKWLNHVKVSYALKS